MTNTPTEMSEEEFDASYPLITNHLNRNASWGDGDGPGCLFETYGDELEFVRQQDPQTVWTFVDGDDGDQYVISGFHFVNRIGYLISTVAVLAGMDIEVRIPRQTDTESGEAEYGTTRPDQQFQSIAKEHLGITTLDTRNSDSLDFHDLAVWQIKAALNAAYNAGVQSTCKIAGPKVPPTSGAVNAVPENPLLLPQG